MYDKRASKTPDLKYPTNDAAHWAQTTRLGLWRTGPTVVGLLKRDLAGERPGT
jgi:hypothetical protein